LMMHLVLSLIRQKHHLEAVAVKQANRFGKKFEREDKINKILEALYSGVCYE